MAATTSRSSTMPEAITKVVPRRGPSQKTPRSCSSLRPWNSAADFAHLSWAGPDHNTLSKVRATSVAEFRAKGYLPEALVTSRAHRMVNGTICQRGVRDRRRAVGWRRRRGVLTIDELGARFSLEKVGVMRRLRRREAAWENRTLRWSRPGGSRS